MHDDIVWAKLLRRDRLIVVAGAAAIALLGWGLSVLPGLGNANMDLVAMAMPSPSAWGPMDLLLVFAIWVVMTVAMMWFRRPPHERGDPGEIHHADREQNCHQEPATAQAVGSVTQAHEESARSCCWPLPRC
jgi:predicted metal-binding membrane protein